MTINVVDPKNNRTRLTLQSDDIMEKSVPKGSFDIIVDGQTVLKNYQFEVGGVYVINIDYSNNDNTVSKKIHNKVKTRVST